MYVEIYPTSAKINEVTAMKYGKGTNKGTLKVRRKYGAATVKVRFARPY